MRVDKVSFTGYDARKLDGFVMQSNYGNVANAMTQIGKIEGFNVYFVKNKDYDSFELSKNQFQQEEKTPPIEFPQDKMDIRGKNLLSGFEDNSITDAVKYHFGLKKDRLEVQARKKHPIDAAKAKLAELISLKPVIIGGEKQYLYNDLQTNKTIPLSEEYVVTTFGKTKESLDKMLDNTHLRGGNYFITKNKSGEDEVLIGADELKKFNEEQIQQMLKVDKIHVIPQMDYHMDLYLRPLDNGKILIADDKLTKQMLAEGFNKIQEAALKLQVQKRPEELRKLEKPFVQTGVYTNGIDDVVKSNNFAQTEETAKVLEDAGFDVIRVPGRLYETRTSGLKNGVFLIHLFNFMNANVLPNKNGELVYITNKSNIDEEVFGITPEIEKLTGFSVQKSFVQAIKPYIKPENIYFISGDNNIMSENLKSYQGGIHCMCSEVPKD